MAVNPNEDTEFNDALRAHGIIPPLPPRTPSPTSTPSPTFSDILNDFTPKELAEISEDAPDEESQRLIERYRLERIAQDKALEKKGRFGRVFPIGRDDYTREVTEASEVDEEGEEGEGKGTAVVCFLYKDGIPRSDRTFEHIRTLATRYPRTKFVSIVGDKCIPNLPDTRIPMLIVYKKGEIRNQVVAWGADRERRIEELEALLLVTGALHPPERQRPEERRGHSSEEDDDDDDDDRNARSKATSTNGRAQKNVRGPAKGNKGDDSDSEFEFDL